MQRIKNLGVLVFGRSLTKNRDEQNIRHGGRFHMFTLLYPFKNKTFLSYFTRRLINKRYKLITVTIIEIPDYYN